MEKLRFEFSLLPASDGKTNIYSVTSIITSENKTYAIPDELQAAGHHKKLMKTAVFNKVKNSLIKRYQTIKVWIPMTKELTETYVDEDGNLQFGDQFLEELEQEQLSVSQRKESGTLEKLFEKLVENTQAKGQHSVKNIADKFVIEKFTSENSDAKQWIDIFEKECIRLEVTTDEKRIEILRLFMDKSSVDWYSSMIMKLTINSEWSTWKEKFCESFANKGWNPVTNALSFKYRDGSLLDYAMRKERLVLEMRKSIDINTLVDLIAAGLPEFILNKIDRESLQDTSDLFNELNKYEHIVNKKNNFGRRNSRNTETNRKNENKSFCKICAGLNKGTRYHPENSCWFRTKEDTKVKKNFIRHVNNSVIEAELNETNQKNEQ